MSIQSVVRAPPHQLTASQVAQQLPMVSAGLVRALARVGYRPTLADIAMVRAQLHGASALLDQLREALWREAAERPPHEQ